MLMILENFLQAAVQDDEDGGCLDAQHTDIISSKTHAEERKQKKNERQNLWNFSHFKLPRWKIIYEYLVAYKNTLRHTMSRNKVTCVSPHTPSHS